MPKKILIIAGEASSDCHAASLVTAINSLRKDISFYGLGGQDMCASGVDVIHNIVSMAVIGPVDVIKHYGELKKIYNDVCSRVKKDKPDCAILIDYPGFNLKIAQFLKKESVPVIYYISPQVWAWGAGRIKKIKKLVDKMLVLFKFEEGMYKKEDINVAFVGHPLLDAVKNTKTKDEFMRQYNLDAEKITIGILPGSRKNEVLRILPLMLESAKLIGNKLMSDKVQFVLPLAKTLEIDFVKNILKESGLDVFLIEEDVYNAVKSCDAAMVASGTATLETALLGVPLAIIYKVSPILYLLVRPIIKIPYIGLVNVIAQEKIVPEFIQYKAKPVLIANYILQLVEDRDYYQDIKGKLNQLKSKLGSSGASLRAAEEVIKFLEYR